MALFLQFFRILDVNGVRVVRSFASADVQDRGIVRRAFGSMDTCINQDGKLSLGENCGTSRQMIYNWQRLVSSIHNLIFLFM